MFETSEVARLLGVAYTTVSNIEKAALKKLKIRGKPLQKYMEKGEGVNDRSYKSGIFSSSDSRLNDKKRYPK